MIKAENMHCNSSGGIPLEEFFCIVFPAKLWYIAYINSANVWCTTDRQVYHKRSAVDEKNCCSTFGTRSCKWSSFC